jgi:hypothetical protein
MSTEHYIVRKTCRLCGSPNLATVIPLRPLPLSSPNISCGAIISETAPADVHQCKACGFVQLNTVVDPSFQYRGFRYFTGISVGLRQHFQALMDELHAAGELGPSSFVFDIGSNDGTLLKCASKHTSKILGIDPAERIAREASASGIPTIGEFFTCKRAEEIVAEHGRANVIFSNNTVANIDNLDDLFGGIDVLLADQGLLIIETQYVLDVVQKTLLDVIYHEHISYFATVPMRAFLTSRGLELIDVKRIEPKGGSIRFYIQRRGGGRLPTLRVDEMELLERSQGLFESEIFETFSQRVERLSEETKEFLSRSRRRTGRALAFGSSVGCAALIAYFDLGGFLDAAFDDTPLTNQIRTAEGTIPVLSGAQLENEMPTDVLVLAWRYLDNIAKRHNNFALAGGRFFSALPRITYAESAAI